MDEYEYKGCGDHGCVIVKPKGVGTNGGCRCHDHPNSKAAIRHLLKMIHVIQQENERLNTLLKTESWRADEMNSQNEQLQAKNNELVEALKPFADRGRDIKSRCTVDKDSVLCVYLDAMNVYDRSVKSEEKM